MTPKEIYVIIAEFIQGFKLSQEDSLNFLNDLFQSSNSSSHKENEKKKNKFLFVIDEIDYLYTRSQEIFYTLFDWANKPASNLIIVSISNTFDLPERIMSNKIISRFVFIHFHLNKID